MPWNNPQGMSPWAFTCGHCGFVVSSSYGYSSQDSAHRVYICPHCDKPSFVTSGVQVPGVAPGAEVQSLPEDIAVLYKEARNAVAVSAYTAAVMTCRKILAHIAVKQGADEGLSFLAYVEYLAKAGYVPPNGRGWVDHIRNEGNEANHEIVVMTKERADELITFCEMLLKFIYEFPSRVPKPKPAGP